MSEKNILANPGTDGMDKFHLWVPMLHGDAESVVARELVVAAAGKQQRLTVARVAPTQVAVKVLRGEMTYCWNFEVLPFVV